MDLAHSTAHRDKPSPMHPAHSKQQSKEGALAAVVQFLIEQACLLHPTSSALSSPSHSLLSAYQSLVKTSELYSLDIGELEGIVSNLIEQKLVGWYTLNAFSLVHFHRMIQRQEGDTWSSQGKDTPEQALRKAQETESPSSSTPPH